MSLHALVIDDDPEIMEDVADRLLSLGHTCDRADCQREARELLQQKSYSYVLLDMEIPSQFGKPARKTNGKNLLCEIRKMDGLKDLPVIVMTSHGLDGPDLAIEVFRDGQATDLVKKPFPSMGENTLEKRIVLALEKSGRTRPGAATRSTPATQTEAQKFEEGEMVFSLTRVELCGVKIAGAVDQTRRRKILDALKEKRSDERFVAYSGDELAAIVGCEYRGQNGVSETVSQFRSETVASFLTEINVTCGNRDIIQSGGRGYRLTEKITIRESNHIVFHRMVLNTCNYFFSGTSSSTNLNSPLAIAAIFFMN